MPTTKMLVFSFNFFLKFGKDGQYCCTFRILIRNTFFLRKVEVKSFDAHADITQINLLFIIFITPLFN
uniref:Putative ovule protein n=1 Tax=Solanum chacoense TaxID=4108 RepID=A0A0V0GMV7_SOLCH